MRIAFDGTTLRPARTGVGCYSERLLRHLAQEGADDEFVVVSNRKADVWSPLPPNVRAFGGRRALVSLAWLQLLAPGVLKSMRADVAHFTNGVMPFASGVPSVVTIHDMSLTLYPHYHPLRRVLLHRPLVDLTARRANAIITHSHAAKHDIVRIYGLDPARVHVVHLAPAPEFVPITDRAALTAVKERYSLPDRFILYVGSIEPRKNFRGSWTRSASAIEPETSTASSSARGLTGGDPATWCAALRRGISRPRCVSSATFRLPTCRPCTTSAACSCFRRCTKDSGFRSSKRWRAASPCSSAAAPRSSKSPATPSSLSIRWTARRWATRSWRSPMTTSGEKNSRRAGWPIRVDSRGNAPPGRR